MSSRVLGLEVAWQNKAGSGNDDPMVVRRMTAAIERAARDFQDFGDKAFPRVITALEGEVADQFLAEGHGPAAGKWAPLNEQYKQAKHKKYGYRPILVATGDLMKALVDSRSSHAIRYVTGTQMVYGTQGVEYASYHQTGTQNRDGSHKMPARPPFDFREQLQKVLSQAAAGAVRDIIKESKMSEHWTTPAQLNRELDTALDARLGDGS